MIKEATYDTMRQHTRAFVACTTHLHYQQLLPNGIANGLTCILDIPDSEDIQVEGHQERHDEVAQ